MVDQSQEDGIAAGGRQVRGSGSTFDDSYIGQTLTLDVLSNYVELTFADIGGEHMAGRERSGENNRHRSKTRANVGDDHSWPESQDIRELGSFGLCLFPLLRHLPGVRVLSGHRGARQNQRGDNTNGRTRVMQT